MKQKQRRTYDVVLVSDFRFSGGNSATNATEIRAQAAAGYRTALVHLPSPLLRRPRPFNGRIRQCLDRGLATLELADQPLRTRLLIIRQPTVLSSVPPTPPDIDADVTLIVANAPPADGVRADPYYRVDEVDRVARELFGSEVTWAPIGPVVRNQLIRDGAPIRLSDEDWHNLIDVDAWSVPRELYAADRPVIGRHSRDHRQKWPSSPAELLAAYPDDEQVRVRILGGAETVRHVIGRVPERWEVLPFDSIAPRDFLAGLDFFVYFPHPEWHEAFGRTVLEAVASGAVVIVPPSFEPLFGPACLYCTPMETQPLVREIYGDRSAYERLSRAGRELVREKFDLEVHAQRLETLIGPPDPATPVFSGELDPPGIEGPAQTSDPPSHVLFVTSGGGLGHLSRMLAIARRASDGLRPLFLTQSESFAAVRDAGLPVEFIPSRKTLGMEPKHWNRLLFDRMRQILERCDVAAVVFDGTMPYRGLLDLQELHPDLPFVWCRRGMWKEGTGEVALGRSDAFDLVVQPGEFAPDHGVTSRIQADNLVRVDPITLIDEEELLDPRAAAERLGLDPDRPAVLVQLSAFEIETLRARARLVVEQLLEIPGMQVCVPHSLMLGRAVTSHPAVVSPMIYPLSPCLPAFTFAITAAGYNLYHELVRFAVPTIFVPLAETATDDQVGRARHAARTGVGLSIEELEPEALAESIDIMRDPAKRSEMKLRARALYPLANGAVAAMQAIERLVEERAMAGRTT